jgi:cytochrome c-type biogenesis protein CcmF
VTVEEASQSTDVTIKLTKGELQRIKGLGIEFQGFSFDDDHRAAMAEGKEFFINARLQIADGKTKRRLDLKMKNTPSGAEFIRAPFVSSDRKTYEISIMQMMPSQQDPSKSAVEINVKMLGDESVPKREETLVVEASIKPMINLVWAGTITLIVGFLLTILRRSEEAKRNGDKWEEEKP